MAVQDSTVGTGAPLASVDTAIAQMQQYQEANAKLSAATQAFQMATKAQDQAAAAATAVKNSSGIR
jgi:hypothetical protein